MRARHLPALFILAAASWGCRAPDYIGWRVSYSQSEDDWLGNSDRNTGRILVGPEFGWDGGERRADRAARRELALRQDARDGLSGGHKGSEPRREPGAGEGAAEKAGAMAGRFLAGLGEDGLAVVILLAVLLGLPCAILLAWVYRRRIMARVGLAPSPAPPTPPQEPPA